MDEGRLSTIPKDLKRSALAVPLSGQFILAPDVNIDRPRQALHGHATQGGDHLVEQILPVIAYDLDEFAGQVGQRE